MRYAHYWTMRFTPIFRSFWVAAVDGHANASHFTPVMKFSLQIYDDQQRVSLLQDHDTMGVAE